MKKKLNLFILGLFIILLTGCSKKDENFKNIQDNGTLISINYENSNLNNFGKSEFYIKEENKKISRISNDAILSFGFTYLNNKNNFLYVDNNGNLQITSKNNFKQIIGENIALKENNKYDSSFGYIERFGYFLNPKFKDTEKAYGISKNGEIIGYIDSKLNFFISKDRNARKYINNNVTSFTIDYFGKNIYYIKDKNKLYLYRNGKSRKIADNIKNFLISKNGNNVLWIDEKYDIYIENIIINNKEKVCNNKNGIYVIINDDNSILYTTIFDNKSKELYRYLNKKNEKIASNVIGFSQYKNMIYYIDKENNLFELDIEDNYKKNKIKSNIKKFVLSNSKIYFLDYDNNIYKKENNKKLEKIASDVSEDYLVIEDTVIYVKNNSIYANNDKIINKIKTFSFNSSYIAYVDTKDQVHVYNVKSKKDSIQIKDAKKYSKIYLGNNFLYQTNLETCNIEGYYCSEEDFFINNKRGNLIEFKENNKVIFFFDDNTKQEYIYKKNGTTIRISGNLDFSVKNNSLDLLLCYTTEEDIVYIYDFKNISENQFSKKIDEIKLINENK